MAAPIAVVIAVFQPGALIDDCLTALLNQEAVGDPEIIVVDSSADGTAERIRQNFSSVTVLALKQQTHQSIARNIGVAHSQAPYVAITDQDCIPPPDWLSRLLSRHQEGHYAAVGGAIVNGTPRSPIGTATYLIEFNEFLPVGHARTVSMIPHCNICFRREIFDTIGPFRPLPPGAEDLVFNFLAAQGGRRLLYDPAITVTDQPISLFPPPAPLRLRVGGRSPGCAIVWSIVYQALDPVLRATTSPLCTHRVSIMPLTSPVFRSLPTSATHSDTGLYRLDNRVSCRFTLSSPP